MLSVVMPAYNEEQYLASAVRAVHGGLADRTGPFEIVVVENGSTDGTYAVLVELAEALPEVRAFSLGSPNYGLALRHGVLVATGDRVAIFDVDYYDLAFLKDALARLDDPDAPAIVVGSKRGEGAADHRPWHRRAITATFATLLRLMFRLSVPDTHGIKVLDRRRTAPLVAACRCRHDLFDSELVLRAERADLPVAYLPVEVVETRAPRSSVLRRVPRTLLGLARLRWALWVGAADVARGSEPGGHEIAQGRARESCA